MMQTNSISNGWRDLLWSEFKRRGMQFLIMVGAVPYFFAVGLSLAPRLAISDSYGNLKGYGSAFYLSSAFRTT
jgi:hypothetical protein